MQSDGVQDGISSSCLCPAVAGGPVAGHVDPRSPGRVFEGIGGLSAGASSRLLFDYPEPMRSDILDYLFKPNFGASLHHVKVEIGGDVNSTGGSESAHARTREEFLNPREEYFNRGYEWWLMKEAKKRNPAILLDVLQWGAPPWIGEEEIKNIDPERKRLNNSRNFTKDPEAKEMVRRPMSDREFRFFSHDNAGFIASFILGARQYHGLDIDFCGVWNEVTYEPAWIKLLRRTLDSKGLRNVKIIAADLFTPSKVGNATYCWDIAKDILADPELASAVHAIGAHYVAGGGSSPEAIETGKPLYASEDISKPGHWPYALNNYGRYYSSSYIKGKVTKLVFWALISSYYDYADFSGRAPMRAATPWSGYYEVWPAIWTTAHYTQFAQPGWRHLDSACAMLGVNGSFVTMMSPDEKEFSVVIETAEAKTNMAFALQVDSRWEGRELAVWRSTVSSQFERLRDVKVMNGRFDMTLDPEAVYSITTTRGQGKGVTAIPADVAFLLPYVDDFAGLQDGKLPKYYSDQEGAFEGGDRPDGQGKCLRQVVTRKGIPWLRGFRWPYTVIGSDSLKDYEVSVDVRVDNGGSVGVGGRISNVKAERNSGYWFEIAASGEWTLTLFLFEPENKGTFDVLVLAQGQNEFKPEVWHSLIMRVNADRITVLLDKKEVASVSDTTYTCGACALMSGWNRAWYSNFTLRTVA